MKWSWVQRDGSSIAGTETLRSVLLLKLSGFGDA